MTEKVGVAYVSKSCDFPKKDIFDSLRKQLKSGFGMYLPKKETLITYISNSKFFLAKITKKENYMLEILENARKIPKNTEKIPGGVGQVTKGKYVALVMGQGKGG